MPESWAKKAKNGILMPAWWNTPADANKSASQTTGCPSSSAATMTMDLETKPENNGKAEMEAAPTMHSPVVTGMDLYSPPSSEPLILPVRNNTAPMDMNSRAL